MIRALTFAVAILGAAGLGHLGTLIVVSAAQVAHMERSR